MILKQKDMLHENNTFPPSQAINKTSLLQELKTKYSQIIVTTVELFPSDTWDFQHPVTSDKKLWSQSISVDKNIPENSDILYNPIHFPGPLLCQIRQDLTSCTMRYISLVPCCVRLDKFWHPVQSDTFPWSFGVSD